MADRLIVPLNGMGDSQPSYVDDPENVEGAGYMVEADADRVWKEFAADAAKIAKSPTKKTRRSATKAARTVRKRKSVRKKKSPSPKPACKAASGCPHCRSGAHSDDEGQRFVADCPHCGESEEAETWPLGGGRRRRTKRRSRRRNKRRTRRR